MTQYPQPPAQPSAWSRFARSNTLKLFLLGFLTLCFLLPLGMVKGVIQERIYYKNQAFDDISQSWAAQQILYGPVLIIPYTKTSTHDYFDHKTQTTKTKTTKQKLFKYALPSTLTANADIETQERYLGIYAVPVYQAALDIKGQFSEIDQIYKALNAENIEIDKPYLSMGLSDVRGIAENISVTFAGNQYAVSPGSHIKNDSDGVHAVITNGIQNLKTADIDISMKLKGIKDFAFVPIGKETKLSVKSPWPDPSFSGQFLPTQRNITDDGFEAYWSTSALASNITHYVDRCFFENSCHELKAQHYSVSLYQSGDTYQQSIRAVKFGILFLSLTFFVFFIYEALKQMRIHPVQYILVGCVLALFFLLLVSLSEHMSFALSYLVASISVVALLAYYIAHMLKDAKMGAFFGVLIAGLYTVLYFILQSQDYALLTGTLFLFTVLTGVMIVTRKMDWYAVSTSREN